MNENKYVYSAMVWSVHDGDTVTVDVDLGFDIHCKMHLRLARIDTPELKGPTKAEAIKSKLFVSDRILAKNVIIKTIKDKKDKYGRYLADIYYNIGESTDYTCINDELVNGRFAVYKSYE